MEITRRDTRLRIQPGMPLSEKQVTQGFRISGGIEGVLTRLFNNLCLDLTGGRGITPIQWNKLMNDYIRKVIESNTAMDRSSIRGNINKELRRPSMTWDVLVRKGLQFLKFEAFTVTVSGELRDGREYHAYTSVSFVPNSRFAHLFPEELPITAEAVVRTGSKGRRGPVRAFANNPGGVLSKLFTLVCLNLTEGKGFSQIQWNQLLTAFIDENEGRLSLERRQSVRGNLNKEFRLSKMTWKVFCKALRFLGAATLTIHITAYREDGSISECETSLNFAQRKSSETK